MTATSRNVAVGLTVLAALVVLGGMIILFGHSPRALKTTYQLKMLFPSAGPVIPGADVRVSGVVVGQVSRVKPMADFRSGVRIYADIEWEYQIPQNCRAYIRPAVMGLGKPAVDIEIVAPSGADATTLPDGEFTFAQAELFLPRDDEAVLAGELRTGFEDLFPREANERLSRVADAIEQMLGTLPEEAATSQPAERAPASLKTVLNNMDRLLARMNELLAADTGDVGVALANFRVITQNAKELSATMKQFAGKANVVADRAAGTLASADAALKTADARLKTVGNALVDTTAKLAGTLDEFTRLLEQVRKGQGTAGKLLNDPRLYENLLLTTDRLNLTIAELRQLIEQWKADGIKLKLK